MPSGEAGRLSLAAPPRRRANSLQPVKWLAQDFLFISIKLWAHYAAPELRSSPGGAKSHFHISLQLAESQTPAEAGGEKGAPLLTELQVKAGNADCEELVFSLS